MSLLAPYFMAGTARCAVPHRMQRRDDLLAAHAVQDPFRPRWRGRRQRSAMSLPLVIRS